MINVQDESDFENKVNDVVGTIIDENAVEDNELNVDSVNISLDEDVPDVEEEEQEEQEDGSTVDEAELYKEKYYLEKKKRKSVLADRQKLEQENHYLRNELDGTQDNNLKLYARDLYNDLEKAKSLKREALLSDNPDLLIEADEIHQKVMHKVNDFENYVANKTPDADEQDGEVLEDDSEEQEKIAYAKEWLNEHPELIEGSYDHNPTIQKKVAAFIDDFDRQLKKHGREDEILTPSYLDVLEEYIDSVKLTKPTEGYTTSKVGAVRNNFSNASTKVRFTMSPYDKEIAKSLNMTPQQYIAYNIKN